MNFPILCTKLQDNIVHTPPKLDSNQNTPKKHHTIPADVLPNASEDLLIQTFLKGIGKLNTRCYQKFNNTFESLS